MWKTWLNQGILNLIKAPLPFLFCMQKKEALGAYQHGRTLRAFTRGFLWQRGRMQLCVVYLYLVSEEVEGLVAKIFQPHFYLPSTIFGNRPNSPGESTFLHNNHLRPRFYPHAYSLENAWYWDTTCLPPKTLDLSAVYHYYSDFVKLTLMRPRFSQTKKSLVQLR